MNIINDVQVVGLHFNVKSQEVEDGISRHVGRYMALKREPNNPYDKNAIAIYLRTDKVGYIKAVHAEILAPLLDDGIRARFKVEKIKGVRYRLKGKLEVNL